MQLFGLENVVDNSRILHQPKCPFSSHFGPLNLMFPDSHIQSLSVVLSYFIYWQAVLSIDLSFRFKLISIYVI